MIDPSVLTDGRQSETALIVQRGTGRLLRALGLAMLTEMPLASGRRADIVALTDTGEVWIVEIKSSVQDLRVDGKWPDYRLHCDRLFFAAPPQLDIGLFPADTGFIRADAYGAEILRAAPEHRLAPATRKAMTLRFARLAAVRLHGLADPGLRLGENPL
ncbi:hypothetical protein EDC22_107213 [Tepidamorphus gemmatus]|jgi:hypothetical protein|uniref:DNA repair protein MmcB-related protein n=1 Tax=Tepidamorphus gemmatus TaxID=747076 RepID=A0A4R3MCZ2_9HYPH|nr:MmcB family DNA repair protein [Tepidamorphus gemmatus]TCT09365.1 hypothetical protein EDC22_107213 [Tepidamorphus gemmatus]